jgi:hypothetical protein
MFAKRFFWSMRSIQFISLDKWFSMTLPQDWAEYDSEEEGTYAFFNSRQWTGNLRVTAIRSANAESTMGERLLNTTFQEKLFAKRKVLGELQCVSFFEETFGDESTLIYYWYMGKGAIILLCSFTINASILGSRSLISEVDLVEQTLASIKLLTANA